KKLSHKVMPIVRRRRKWTEGVQPCLQGGAMKTYKALLVLLFLFIGSWAKGAGNSLSAEDVTKIKAVHSKYEEAWLKGDADGVRALFTGDCVILPPHGDKPRIGQKGLNEFWFPPDAPPTKITRLVVTPQSIGGDGQIAYVWGT